MKTKATTWLAQIVAVAVLLAAGTASASSGFLAGNSCRGKNSLEGGFHQGSASVSGGTLRACGDFCHEEAADSVVAPKRLGGNAPEGSPDFVGPPNPSRVPQPAEPNFVGPPPPRSTFKNLFPNEATSPHPNVVRPSTLLKGRGAKVYDYVVKENGELVIGEKVSGAGHANLAQGQPVRAAGEIRVSGGKIIEIDNASGHYLPKGANSRNAALDAFREAGFEVPGQVYIEKFFNEVTKLWEAVK